MEPRIEIARPPANRTPSWVAAVVGAAVVGLAGGWAIGHADASTPAASPAAPAIPQTTTQVTVRTSPTETGGPAGTTTLKLGQSHKFTSDGTLTTVTALAHRRFQGNEGVQVRTCNVGDKAFSVSAGPWRLSYDKGEQLVDIIVTGGGLLSPPYTDRDLTGGKCAKGWITFEASPGSPDGVEYHLDTGVNVRWQW
ncbi:hypothetical protein ACQP2X_39110 [Actinoplanes sp. CA-131856]